MLFVKLSSAQELISYELLGSITEAEAEEQTGQDAVSGVDYYKLIYSLIDHNNQLDTASGLVAIPSDISTAVALVAYQHGTTDSRDDVPSNLEAGSYAATVFASQGFVCSAADYIGMGDSDGFHLYVHAASEAAAGVYFIKAAQSLCVEIGRNLRPEMFVAGYSQGGHAAMALQREIQTNWTADLEITACGHGSGPYSISEIMRLQMLADEQYAAGVAFLPYTILAYQEAYGNLYDDLTDMFKNAYITDIQRFYDGQITLSEMGFNLGFLLLANEGFNARVYHLLQDTIVSRLQANDPQDSLIIAMKDNDTYEWQAMTPTRLYYCDADATVPFENSIFADSAMNALGARDLEAVQVNPNADHGACAEEAIPLIIDYFNSFLNAATEDNTLDGLISAKISPNPVSDHLIFRSEMDMDFTIYSLGGIECLQGKLSSGWAQLDLSNLEPGQYIIRLRSNRGILNQSFVKVR